MAETPQTEQIAQLEAMVAASPHQAALQRMADGMHNSPRQRAAQNFSEGINNSPMMVAQRMRHEQMFGVTQRVEDEALLQGKSATTAPAQLEKQAEAKPNNTGLPDNLKSGIENLSGMSMDNVKVHYNSAQPAQLNALAYAQGSDIHVAPGQEQHLPHEAWHVVQQAQGRVKPTMQMKEGVPVNDDKGLECEADVMGVKSEVHGATVQAKKVSVAGERGNGNAAPVQAVFMIQLMSAKQAAALDAFDYGSGAITLIDDNHTADGERLRVYTWAHDDGGRGLEVHWHGDVYDEKRINVRWIDDEAQSGREIPQGLLSVFKKAVGG